MATIRAFTTIEQSKKLAEILPLESADMYYEPSTGFRTEPSEAKFGDIKYAHPRSIRCWSLAALLNILPKGEYKDVDLCFGGYQGDKYISEWFCSYEQQEPFIIEVCHADNPIDACVAMVEKLNELKLL